MNKETVEQAAEKEFPFYPVNADQLDNISWAGFLNNLKIAFKAGVEWQATQTPKQVSAGVGQAANEVVLHETILYAMGFSSAFTSDPQEGYHASKVFQKNSFEVHMPDESIQSFVDKDGNDIKYLSNLIKLLSSTPTENNPPSIATDKELTEIASAISINTISEYQNNNEVLNEIETILHRVYRREITSGTAVSYIKSKYKVIPLINK